MSYQGLARVLWVLVRMGKFIASLQEHLDVLGELSRKKNSFYGRSDEFRFFIEIFYPILGDGELFENGPEETKRYRDFI